MSANHKPGVDDYYTSVLQPVGGLEQQSLAGLFALHVERAGERLGGFAVLGAGVVGGAAAHGVGGADVNEGPHGALHHHLQQGLAEVAVGGHIVVEVQKPYVGAAGTVDDGLAACGGFHERLTPHVANDLDVK